MWGNGGDLKLLIVNSLTHRAREAVKSPSYTHITQGVTSGFDRIKHNSLSCTYMNYEIMNYGIMTLAIGRAIGTDEYDSLVGSTDEYENK